MSTILLEKKSGTVFLNPSLFALFAKACYLKNREDESAVIGSNLEYAAIHQLGGQAGKNKSVEIPARPYLQLTPEDFEEILQSVGSYLK